MRAILYVGHGTRSKKGAAEAKSFLQKIIRQTNISIQEISFLELTEPFIEEGFIRCVKKGAAAITVVPLFLLKRKLKSIFRKMKYVPTSWLLL